MIFVLELCFFLSTVLREDRQSNPRRMNKQFFPLVGLTFFTMWLLWGPLGSTPTGKPTAQPFTMQLRTQQPATTTPEPATSRPPTSEPPTPEPSTAEPPTSQPPPPKPTFRLGIITVNYPHTDFWWKQAVSDITHRIKARYAAEYHEHVDFISVNTANGDFPTDGASTDIGTPSGLRPLYNHSLFSTLDPAPSDVGASWEWLAKNHSIFVDYERNPNTTTPILTSAISWLSSYEWLLILDDDVIYARPEMNITVWLDQRAKINGTVEKVDAIFSGEALFADSGLLFLRRSVAMKRLLMHVQDAVQASPYQPRYLTEFVAIVEALKVDASLRVLKIPGLLTPFQCFHGNDTLVPIPPCEHEDCTLFKQFSNPYCGEVRKSLWQHLKAKEPGSHVGLTRYPFSNPVDGSTAMKVLSGVLALKRVQSAGIGRIEEFSLKVSPVKTRSKFAILCASSGSVEDITLRSMVLSSAWNKEKYAERHGYDLIMEDADGAGIPDRTGHWVKFGALAKWLPHYEWIYWVDVDSVVMNFTVTLESIVEHANKVSGQTPSFIVAPDSRFLNTGSFLIRNTPKTMEFLDDSYNTPATSWHNWEQGAIIYTVQGDKKLSEKYGVGAGFTTIISASVFNSFPTNWFVPGVTWTPGEFLMHFPAFNGSVLIDGNRITYYLAALDKSHRMNNVERWPSGLQNWYDDSGGIRRKPFTGV